MSKDNKKEDLEDIEEIKKQKQEQRKTNEEMSSWEFGKGVQKKRKKT